MAANWRDGRWHVVKAFPKPFMWMRRQWLALRWDGEGWERYGRWYSQDRAEAEVRLLNETEDWIANLHGWFGTADGFDPATGEIYELKVDVNPQQWWANHHQNPQLDAYMQAFPVDRPDGPTLRALDRSHLGCG